MSEAPIDETPAVPEAVLAPTAGSLLREARENAGLHIAALAVSLKVPVKKLEALESDRLDLLPDAVFVRALAASVCRTLKMDPAPVLEKLPGSAVPRLVPDASGINTPFRSPRDGPGPSWRDQLTRPAMLAVLALLLAALVLIFLPAVQPLQSVAKSLDPASAPSQSDGVAVAQAASAAPTVLPPVSQPVAAGQQGDAAPLAPATMSLPSAAPAPTPVGAAAQPGTATLPTVNGQAEGGLVVFKTRGESWVEVTDAKGQVALRRTMAAGESAGASGALPLAVVVGRSDATEVTVRGKPLDLAPVSRDNVARFEVK